jgi:uncharacterized hydrophobic protein (TIGR00271 family)
MLRLEAYVSGDRVEQVGEMLGALAGVRHVTTGAPTKDGLVTVSALVDPGALDVVLDRLTDADVADQDINLWELPAKRRLGWRPGSQTSSDDEVWADVVGRAGEYTELAWIFVLYMVAAGVIAGVGVVTGSAILLVGAMAISPDLLPIAASAIGIVERRWHMAIRAIRVLFVGLGAGATGAFAATALLRLFNRIPDDLVLADTMMGEALTQLGPGSLIVAAAAGVAGMVAFERPGGAAVGVAISVTTIPAASYVGAALAMGRDDPMFGAMGVLITNVIVLVITSSLTLAWQGRQRRRRTAARE